MTDIILRPRDAAADAGEPDPLLLCAPLRIEARALRRGLRAGGLGGVVPPGHALAGGSGPAATGGQASRVVPPGQQ